MLDLRIAIAGTGAVGESLAVSLTKVGIPVFCILSRNTQTARTLADKVDAQFAVQYGDTLPEGIALLFLCIPDDSIAATSAQLASQPYDWARTCVAHTSGALTASVLAPLESLGAKVFSFHPMQTFTPEHESEWPLIMVGIEGDEIGVRMGQQLAESLGSTPLLLKSEDKVLYHASAVFASNFLVTLIGIATDILNEIHVSRDDALKLLGPLIKETCHNVLAYGPERALTGPASRGDVQTIKSHANSLRSRLPAKFHVYLELTREAVELKLRSDSAFKEKAERMKREIKP